VVASGTTAIYGSSTSAYGVYGEANGNYGVYGRSMAYGFGGVLGYDHTLSYYGIVGLNGASGAWAFYRAGSAYVSGTYQGSDRRLKNQITPLTSALNLVNQLQPVSFEWKKNSEQHNSIQGKDYGFIAQDVEKILPEVVREISSPEMPNMPGKRKTLNQELGKFKTVEYTRFIPWLAQAIKELYDKVVSIDEKTQTQSAAYQQQIDALKKANIELRTENTEFRNRLDIIEKMLKSK
jgi:hypothetical protein